MPGRQRRELVRVAGIDELSIGDLPRVLIEDKVGRHDGVGGEVLSDGPSVGLVRPDHQLHGPAVVSPEGLHRDVLQPERQEIGGEIARQRFQRSVAGCDLQKS